VSVTLSCVSESVSVSVSASASASASASVSACMQCADDIRKYSSADQSFINRFYIHLDMYIYVYVHTHRCFKFSRAI
jgi:hypothetical protein